MKIKEKEDECVKCLSRTISDQWPNLKERKTEDKERGRERENIFEKKDKKVKNKQKKQNKDDGEGENWLEIIFDTSV